MKWPLTLLVASIAWLLIVESWAARIGVFRDDGDRARGWAVFVIFGLLPSGIGIAVALWNLG